MYTTVTIGIIFYNNSTDDILKCFRGILNQTAIAQIPEVIVIDQGGGENADHILQWKESQDNLSFNLVILKGENKGFGGGHNILVNNSTSDLYLALNPDGFMHPTCLEELLTLAKIKNWNGLFEAIQEPIMHPKYYDPNTGLTDWCSGACLLMSKSIYKYLNGFDEDFFLYCEDVDISWRARANNIQCFTCSTALFFHFAEDRKSRQIEIWKSAMILAYKWRSKSFYKFSRKILMEISNNAVQSVEKNMLNIKMQSHKSVRNISPNFNYGLNFSKPMWKKVQYE